LRVAVPVCCVAGYFRWIFNGVGHEWHLRLPRSAVFYFPIVSLPARVTASIRNRFLAISPYSRSHCSLHRLKAKREKIPDTIFMLNPTKLSLTVFSCLCVILIWAHFLLSAAISQAEHILTFQNSKEEKGLLIDGTKGGTWINDWTQWVPAGMSKFSIPISSRSPANSPEGQIIAFSKGRVPVLMQHLEWQATPNPVQIEFGNPIEIELAIWIITSRTPEGTPSDRTGGYETRKNDILDFHCATANNIWSSEAHGLRIRCHPENRTRHDDRITVEGGVINANKFFSSTPFNCEAHGKLIRKVGYNPNAINVYYVYTVHADAAGLVPGIWCDASLNQKGGDEGFPNIIAIGVTALDETLAHELGHAFSLSHINAWAAPKCDNPGSNPKQPCLFDGENLMYGAEPGRRYLTRRYLTEGQVFRVFFNDNSALNTIYKVGRGTTLLSGKPERFCGTIPKNDDDRNNCPTIDKRLWADGPKWPPQPK
jgi:hypothetical protein